MEVEDLNRIFDVPDQVHILRPHLQNQEHKLLIHAAREAMDEPFRLEECFEQVHCTVTDSSTFWNFLYEAWVAFHNPIDYFARDENGPTDSWMHS